MRLFCSKEKYIIQLYLEGYTSKHNASITQLQCDLCEFYQFACDTRVMHKHT